MSEGYTQVAVVQYRHCTTSCHDYRVCCEFFKQSVAVVGGHADRNGGGGIQQNITGIRYG